MAESLRSLRVQLLELGRVRAFCSEYVERQATQLTRRLRANADLFAESRGATGSHAELFAERGAVGYTHAATSGQSPDRPKACIIIKNHTRNYESEHDQTIDHRTIGEASIEV